MINTLSLEESHELYRQTHNQYPDYFQGFSLVSYIFEIGELIQKSNIKTVIDYGCGKAKAWETYQLKKLWGIERVDFYDPGVESFISRPLNPSDLLISIDVLEHVPEHLVDIVLDDMCRLSKKAMFVNVSTRPASKKLIDGSNAHATVKPISWWQHKIDRLDKLVISRFTS